MLSLNVNLDKTSQAKLNKLIRKFPEAIQETSRRTAVWGKERIVRDTPARTGAARGSWIVKKHDNLSYEIVSSVGRGAKYTPFLEHGTGLRGPRKRLIRSKTPGKPLRIQLRTGRIFRMYQRGMKKVGMVTKNLAAISNQFHVEFSKLLKGLTR